MKISLDETRMRNLPGNLYGGLLGAITVMALFFTEKNLPFHLVQLIFVLLTLYFIVIRERYRDRFAAFLWVLLILACSSFMSPVDLRFTQSSDALFSVRPFVYVERGALDSRYLGPNTCVISHKGPLMNKAHWAMCIRVPWRSAQTNTSR